MVHNFGNHVYNDVTGEVMGARGEELPHYYFSATLPSAYGVSLVESILKETGRKWENKLNTGSLSVSPSLEAHWYDLDNKVVMGRLDYVVALKAIISQGYDAVRRQYIEEIGHASQPTAEQQERGEL